MDLIAIVRHDRDIEDLPIGNVAGRSYDLRRVPF
jgi:hypothetical protein